MGGQLDKLDTHGPTVSLHTERQPPGGGLAAGGVASARAAAHGTTPKLDASRHINECVPLAQRQGRWPKPTAANLARCTAKGWHKLHRRRRQRISVRAGGACTGDVCGHGGAAGRPPVVRGAAPPKIPAAWHA